MQRLALAALFVALVAGTAPARAGDARPEGIDKVNGSITASAGNHYGDLETVNGSIRIEAGARTGDASTVNGGIKVAERAQTGSLATVNGDIRLGREAQVDGDLETVNGEVFMDRGSRASGAINNVNGAIGLIQAQLGEGIETVNSDITVGVGSHVRGGIKVDKPDRSWLPISMGKRRPPRIIIGADAIVDGALVFEREVKLYVHDSAKIGAVTGATAQRYHDKLPPSE